MKIKLAKQAIKQLDRMDNETAKRILDGIRGLAEIPPKGDIKPLQGFKQRYRLRIGQYRVLYGKTEGEIQITDIGSRGDIYK